MTAIAHRMSQEIEILAISLLLVATTHAVLAYQKYRFQNGVALGVSLAAIAIYNSRGRRLGLCPDRVERLLVGVLAAGLTILIQRLCK